NVARGGIAHEARDGEGADAGDAAQVKDFFLLFEGFDAADAGADDHTAADGIFACEIDSSVVNGNLGAGQPKLAEAIEALGIPAIDAVPGDVEAGALTAEATGILGGIPAGDHGDSTFAGAKMVPHLVGGFAKRCDDA